MSFLQAFLGFNKIKRTLYMLSFLWLLLISSITCVSCFDVSVSPGSICCGDWVTVTISLTNNGDSVFSGRLEIYIIDANGYQDRMDGLSITLQPHESRTFQTRIRPKDCKSYGTYQVVVKLVDNNGREQGTRTSSFAVKNPTSCQLPPECTWTFTCDNNIVKRLCVDQSGKEYWKEYDDCNKYNPPRKCINGVCVDVDIPPTCNQQTCPPPSQCIDGRCEPPCDQQACQNQNRPIGTPYTKNGLQYQKYMECGCVNNQCKCDEVEKEVSCTGIISGHVYDRETNSPIKGATLQITQSKYLSTNPTDGSGYFSTGKSCPSTLTTLTCSGVGYESDKGVKITDEHGNLEMSFGLKPLPPRNDLAINYVESPGSIGMGEEFDVRIVLYNKGDTNIKSSIPIKLQLVEDANIPGHHSIPAYLSPNKCIIRQEYSTVIDLDLKPGDISVNGPYKIKVSDNFEDYCIFANRLRAELEYPDDDISNNRLDEDLFVTIGTRSVDCAFSAFMMALGLAVGETYGIAAKTEIQLTPSILKSMEKPFGDALIAFEKRDTDAAAKAIVDLATKLPPNYQTDFVVNFAQNFVNGLFTSGECVGASVVVIHNFFIELENDLKDAGMQPLVNIIHKIAEEGLTKL